MSRNSNDVRHQLAPRENSLSKSWAVQQALSLEAEKLSEPSTSRDLLQMLAPDNEVIEQMDFKDFFFMDDVPLPCFEESHLTLYGNWLTAPDNYPIYYSIFRKFTTQRPSTRMLEIGVFTGYSGTVFARAAHGKAFYLGVDPNIYLSFGLHLASRTFKALRLKLENFDFALIEGFSWEEAVQRSILFSAPYDLVHIDGDHTLEGKLVDLELARQVISTHGIVLVDDYDHHPCVADAIKCAMASGWFKEFAYIPKMRGLAALRV